MVAAGFGMPTLSQHVERRGPAPPACCPRWCSRIASSIWLPTVCTGDSDGHRLLEDHRRSRRRGSRGWRCPGSQGRPGRPARSPARWSTMSAGRRSRRAVGTMRRIDCAVTLLPQPLSPMMPRVCPWWTVRLTPSTALSVPSSSEKWVLRSLSSSTGAWVAVSTRGPIVCRCPSPGQPVEIDHPITRSNGEAAADRVEAL